MGQTGRSKKEPVPQPYEPVLRVSKNGHFGTINLKRAHHHCETQEKYRLIHPGVFDWFGLFVIYLDCWLFNWIVGCLIGLLVVYLDCL